MEIGERAKEPVSWDLNPPLISVYAHQLPRCTGRALSIHWAWCVVLSCSVIPTLRNPMDCSLPGSSVHGILQARILQWVAVPSSRGSSQPRDQTQVSRITGGFFTIWDTREAQEDWSGQPIPSPGDLPDPGIKWASPALQGDSLPVELPAWGH